MSNCEKYVDYKYLNRALWNTLDDRNTVHRETRYHINKASTSDERRVNSGEAFYGVHKKYSLRFNTFYNTVSGAHENPAVIIMHDSYFANGISDSKKETLKI